MINRRSLLTTSGAMLVSSLVNNRTVFAQAPTDNRLVIVLLRGGLDGLHALPPYEDKHYRMLRPSIAVEKSSRQGDLADLDGYFGLHPALASLKPLYDSGELLLIPAASTQYRSRSHFDGQNMLENGSGKPYGARDGWLNRAILGLNDNDQRLGLALGPSIPLILQGEANIQTWAQSRLPELDDDFLVRLGQLYKTDALFLDAFHDANGALKPDLGDSMQAQNKAPNKDFTISAKAAADLLARRDGPRIAVMEIPGWDTHFGQINRLNRLLARLAEGLLELKSGLQQSWQNTTVVIVSEFGRTVAENGNRGTDHGTGGIAILAGGAIRGGRIAGDWPGLSRRSLYEGRDLLATTSYESLFKSLLIGHLGLTQGFVEDRVFPDSRAIVAAEDLLHRT